MSPERIEQIRKNSVMGMTPAEHQQLCELALDGLMFRGWVDGAARCPALVAQALAPCVKPEDYRRAITGLLASGRIRAQPQPFKKET